MCNKSIYMQPIMIEISGGGSTGQPNCLLWLLQAYLLQLLKSLLFYEEILTALKITNILLPLSLFVWFLSVLHFTSPISVTL